jgi:hypothetical protein
MIAANKYKVHLYLVFAFLLASCTKPNQYFAKERYIVTSKNLNIRIDPTQLSRTIGTLSKGDTIIALASDKYWVMVKVEDQTGFVSNEYLKKLGPISSPKIVASIERYADWKSWKFWLISTFLVTIWIAAGFKLMIYENQLKSKSGINAKKISITPLVFFVSGILTALLYLFWKDQVIETLFYNFSIIPKGMGSIAWIIWIQCLVVVIGVIIDFIGSIYISGLKYGYVTFLMEFGISLIIFITSFFLTISLFVAAIVFLIVFFAIFYTIIITENSKSISKI